MSAEKPALKVGDTIWQFDQNRRVYPPREPGRSYSSGSPIYAEHWRPVVIHGETTKSWLVGSERWPEKIPKAGARKGYLFTRAEVDDDIYAAENRHKLARRIEDAPVAVLRQIEALLDAAEPK